jgi:hypothetical protein
MDQGIRVTSIRGPQAVPAGCRGIGFKTADTIAAGGSATARSGSRPGSSLRGAGWSRPPHRSWSTRRAGAYCLDELAASDDYASVDTGPAWRAPRFRPVHLVPTIALRLPRRWRIAPAQYVDRPATGLRRYHRPRPRLAAYPHRADLAPEQEQAVGAADARRGAHWRPLWQPSPSNRDHPGAAKNAKITAAPTGRAAKRLSELTGHPRPPSTGCCSQRRA